MELKRIFVEFLRLRADWTERCDVKNAGSFNQSLNKLAMNDMRDIFNWCWSSWHSVSLEYSEIGGMHEIPIVIIAMFWPVVVVHLKEGTQDTGVARLALGQGGSVMERQIWIAAFEHQ